VRIKKEIEMYNMETILGKVKDYLLNPLVKKMVIAALLFIVAIFFCLFKNNTDEQYVIESNEVIEENQSHVIGEIYVDIDGCVVKPGVYKVEEGTRLFEIIEMAGGVSIDGDVTSINRAKEVSDGEKIIIPKVGEQTASNGLININLADAGKLEELPGIGPVTAQMIIDYRESNNGFDKIEDILNIKGIGTATFNKIKEEITV
jgi:competence protein ComEA